MEVLEEGYFSGEEEEDEGVKDMEVATHSTDARQSRWTSVGPGTNVSQRATKSPGRNLSKGKSNQVECSDGRGPVTVTF